METEAYIGATQTGPSRLSTQSKRWLLSLARTKYNIEFAALDTMKSKYMWVETDEYRSWLRSLEDRRSKTVPGAEDEAWSFILDDRGCRFWRAAREVITTLYCSHGITPSCVEQERSASSLFVHLGRQLLDTASAVNVDDLGMLSDIIDAVDLQLYALGPFGDLYHRNLTKDGSIVREPFYWHHNLRGRIDEAVQKTSDQKAARFTRSPSQHYQDNLLLQATVCVLLLACVYPLYRTLRSSSPIPGSTSDADFWQQITNTIVQISGFLTLLVPIYRETAAKDWIGTWILTALGIASAVVAIPLYPFVPISWSIFFSWLAASVQLLVVLQVALVAAFRDQEHAKQD